MKQKVLCLLIALPLMLVMRVLVAQDFDKRLFGKWQGTGVFNVLKLDLSSKGQDAIGESHAKVRDVTQTVTEPVSGTVEAAKKKVEGVETAGSEVVRGVIEDTLNHSAEAQQKIYDEAKAYNSELSEELARKAASASEKAVPKESGSGFFKTFGKLFKKSESGQMEKNPQSKNASTNTQSNSNQLP
ncbi:hypothetical protein BPIT_22680 [Candidatus Brocadia pituitae]|nr:hypothetical protein BPIT_22680 [Candidatus Brocadia pituitae]